MKIEIENICETSADFCDEIKRISAKDLSYNDFFHSFMSNNLPVIITDAQDILTSTSAQWFRKSNNSIDIHKLEEALKDHEVPIANCSRQYFNSHEKISMKFSGYASYWREEREEGKDLLYLKDFHLKNELPHINFYNVPQYFASDWLNEFLLDTSKDDYRFVYLGVQNTFTNFHSDVYNSFSWSANISGTKRWFILPRHEENKLKDEFGKFPFTVDERLLKERNVKYFDITQSAYELIFVPSGYWHQVHNLTDVFSINHNWFNGCNVLIVLEDLLKNFESVKREIDDCKDMENFEEHCQIMLKSVYGMNIAEFIEIVVHIAEKRIANGCEIKLFDKYSLGNEHIMYDIQIAKKVLDKLSKEQLNKELKLFIENCLNKFESSKV